MTSKEFVFNDNIKITSETFADALTEFVHLQPNVKIQSLVVIKSKEGEGEQVKEKIISMELINKINNEILMTQITPILIKGFQNFGGTSCFLDSVLFPLLLVESCFRNTFINDEIIYPNNEQLNVLIKDIQKILLDLINQSVNGERTTCSLLSKKLRELPKFKELFSGQQQDDSEFLVAFMDLFKLEPTKSKLIRKVSNDGVNWFTSSERTLTESIIEMNIPEKELLETTENKQVIENNLLSIVQQKQIQDYSDKPVSEWPRYAVSGVEAEEIPYRFGYEHKIIESSNCLVFHINRKLLGKKNRNPISFTKLIQNTETNVYYNLTIVTVHHGGAIGGHYIAYFLFNGDWYLYDDLSNNLRIVDYSVVKKDAERDSSLLFYFP